MAAVVCLTSILLALLRSDVAHAAVLPTDHSKVSSEPWPPLYWGPQWQPVVPNWSPQSSWRAPGSLLQKPNTVKNTKGNVPPENPEKQVSGPEPRSFHFSLSNTEDTKKGQAYSQSQEPGQFHLASQMKSPSRVSSQAGSFQDPQDSSKAAKSGFQLSFFVTGTTTTAAPKTTGSVVNYGFNYPYNMLEVNKPIYQRPLAPKVIYQKPPESKLMSFLSGLLNQKGQSNQNTQTSTHTQQNPVIYKPVVQSQPSSQSVSGSLSGHHQTPTNYWMSQMHLSSKDAERGAQNPVYQVVQNMPYSRVWLPVTNPDSLDIKNSILHSAKYVDGQLMIPLEKCLWFERFAPFLEKHYPGQVYHHVHTPPSVPVQTKPPYTHFFLNVEGSAPNPTQGTNVQQPGAYQETPFRSQNQKTDHTSVHFYNPLSYTYVHKEPNSQHSVVKPGQANYMVQLGANVGVDQQPDLQSQSNYEYIQQGNNLY